MATIAPFKALRPQPQFAKQVASRPYDVLNSKEAKKEAQGNPDSYLHITKPEIDLPENTDPYSLPVYEKAKENLQAFLQREVLFRENKPCYYIYQLIMNNRSQTGLVCVSAVDDYENNVIKKHEFTRPDKELDRINHMKISGAQTGNVFLAYRSIEEVDTLIGQWKQQNVAVYDFSTEDGIRHTVWVVNIDNVIQQISHLFTKRVTGTYIADGHHRAASAAKVRKALGDKTPIGAGYFLTTLFPSNQLYIMEYNRAVKDLNGLEEPAFLDRVTGSFHIEKMIGQHAPAQLHEFGMYLSSGWYKLTANEGSYSTDPISILDVTILQNNLLDKILNIKDQRTDKRIDFIGGIRGLGELENRVNSGEMKVAFCLYPVSIQQLFDIADSGQVMPPKSTWFEPKLRDGLFTHLID